MKKGFAACLAAVLLALLLPASALAEGTVTEISDAAGLLAMADAPEGSYVLTADIDLRDTPWTPFAFAGKLDGDGHAILNLTVREPGAETEISVDGNDLEYDTVFAGLFSTLRGEVRSLTLLGADIAVTTEENCFVGLVAGYGEDAVIADCTLVACRASLTQSAYQCGVGGVLGFGSGTVSGCQVEATLVFVDTNRDENCEEFLGGVCACGDPDVTDCQVSLSGYASVHGYVHNGGLVGMFYDYAGYRVGTVTGNNVFGFIRFFEDNWDRRAYCEAYIGELLGECNLSDNTETFVSAEVTDYDTDLLPETCAEPSVDALVLKPTCTEYGYTEWRCAVCGNHWRGAFTLPAHTLGPWETVTEPTFTSEGLERRACTVCGEVAEERVLPAHVAGDWLIVKAPTYLEDGLECLYCATCGVCLEERPLARLRYVEEITLSDSHIAMNYHGVTRLNAQVYPAQATDPEVGWTSSDGSVVTVQPDGTLTAVGRGSAVVSCGSRDGGAAADCQVEVTFTWWQWVIWTVCFGFLWY